MTSRKINYLPRGKTAGQGKLEIESERKIRNEKRNDSDSRRLHDGSNN